MNPHSPMWPTHRAIVLGWAIAVGAAMSGVTLNSEAMTQSSTHSQMETQARRVSDRLRALQREAEQLAVHERSLLEELRQMEIDRERKAEALKIAEAELTSTVQTVAELEQRLATLNQAVASTRPQVQSRLVEMYKLGKAGYLRLLFSAEDARTVGRTLRTVSAMAREDQTRITRYVADEKALRIQHQALEQKRHEMVEVQARAREARANADRSIAQRASLVDTIDKRRDLHAQLVGELQTAQRKLSAALASSTPSSNPILLPLRAFKGELAWPAAGPVMAAYGRQQGRFTGTMRRHGIEISTTSGSAVRAVHEGRVVFAGPFTGFNNLVIIDHGSQSYTSYGFLSALKVREDDTVSAGSIVGTSGLAPAGGPAVYFEVRIDGKPVDPLEWLKRR